jgi:hypothetical protein
MAVDWVLGWLKAMCMGGLIPPFCVEIVLRDGRSYYLHSVIEFEKETQTLVARIWDLRAFTPKEIDELKLRVNEIRDRKDLSPAEAVHPKLDWANLRLHFDDVTYCVEWHDRLWPEDARPKMGFRRVDHPLARIDSTIENSSGRSLPRR